MALRLCMIYEYIYGNQVYAVFCAEQDWHLSTAVYQGKGGSQRQKRVFQEIKSKQCCFVALVWYPDPFSKGKDEKHKRRKFHNWD